MSPLRSSKDELLQNINKVDREICQTESQIMKLRKRQVKLMPLLDYDHDPSFMTI